MSLIHTDNIIKPNIYSKLIYRHTEGKYKDGITRLIDKKISVNNDDGLVIKLVNKLNKNVNIIHIRFNPNNSKDYFLTEQENNNGQKSQLLEQKFTFDQLIENVKGNSLLKFIIDYFISIKENGSRQACFDVHGQKCIDEVNLDTEKSTTTTYLKLKNCIYEKCIFKELETDIDKNIYISDIIFSKIQRESNCHTRKMSKRMTKKLAKKLTEGSHKTVNSLPKSTILTTSQTIN